MPEEERDRALAAIAGFPQARRQSSERWPGAGHAMCVPGPGVRSVFLSWLA